MGRRSNVLGGNKQKSERHNGGIGDSSGSGGGILLIIRTPELRFIVIILCKL